MLNAQSWLGPWEDLLAANLPMQDQTVRVAGASGALYRQHLGHLTPEEWRWAVDQAIKTEKWFPPIAVLLEHATTRRPEPQRFLMARTPEALAADREETRRGLEAIRAAVGPNPPPLPAWPTDKAPTLVEASPERVALLQRQAREAEEQALAPDLPSGEA